MYRIYLGAITGEVKCHLLAEQVAVENVNKKFYFLHFIIAEAYTNSYSHIYRNL